MIKEKLTLDTWLTVQFCPSGEIQERNVRWIMNNGGLRQLQAIRKGVKLDAPTFHDSKMDD